MTPKQALDTYHFTLQEHGYCLKQIEAQVRAIDPEWKLSNKDFVEALTKDLDQRLQKQVRS